MESSTDMRRASGILKQPIH